MVTTENDILITIIISVVLIALLLFFAIIVVYQYIVSLKQKHELQIQFEQEVNKAQLEIQEQTIENIGRDLHDNLGQLLVVAKLQISSNKIPESKETITNALAEMRNIAKSLNPDYVQKFGLAQAIQHDLKRISHIETEWYYDEEPHQISNSVSLILYRIVQEFITNSLKYAQCSKISVRLRMNNSTFVLNLADNGKGFVYDLNNTGTGIGNIKKRAELIGAKALITSSIGNGTTLEVSNI